MPVRDAADRHPTGAGRTARSLPRGEPRRKQVYGAGVSDADGAAGSDADAADGWSTG